jgi:hypothetical protein
MNTRSRKKSALRGQHTVTTLEEKAELTQQVVKLNAKLWSIATEALHQLADFYQDLNQLTARLRQLHLSIEIAEVVQGLLTIEAHLKAMQELVRRHTSAPDPTSPSRTLPREDSAEEHRPSTGPEKRSAPRGGQRLRGAKSPAAGGRQRGV